ncbi:MAG: NIPSNAP family protein, partial [Comamonadaceae bacterium]
MPNSSAAPQDACTSIELRRYRLRPGRRAALAELFLRELVQPQEQAGMRVIGPYRDLDAPDDFVWLRGFAGLEQRAAALAGFYGGPVWGRHADAANATMLNSDNVLLLRPAGGGAFDAETARAACGLLEVTTCSLPPGAEAGFHDFFAQQVRPALEDAGARVLQPLVTEQAPNGFPRLPVRAGETALVWLAAYATAADWALAQDRLAASAAWSSA